MTRKIDYLRISLTDRCNCSCFYCMPKEGMCFYEPDQHMRADELLRAVRIFRTLGIKKIRLTGGEPLLRSDLVLLIKEIKKISGIEEICLTTNGILLAESAEDLKKAGVSRINISLDTLDAQKYRLITQTDKLDQIFNGIRVVKSLGFSPIKLNMVLMRGVNDDEVMDFIRFSMEEDVILRFIEFMKVTPLWEESKFFSVDDLIRLMQKKITMDFIGPDGASPAKYYKVLGKPVGFIKTSESNCSRCSRLRLSSDGILKLCLYEKTGTNVRSLFKKGLSDVTIQEIISEKMHRKLQLNYKNFESGMTYMSRIGG